MRISDWSSDVCSSDLVRDPRHRGEDHLGSDGVGTDAHRRILPAGRRPDRARACGDCPDPAAWSSTAAPGALVFTEAMPSSRPDSSASLWLLPTAWPSVAVRLKHNFTRQEEPRGGKEGGRA